MKRWLRRNPTEAALFAGAGLLILLNLGGIKNMLAQQEITRQSVAESNRQIQQIELNEEKKRELAEIANARYDAGCEVVVALDRPDHYRALVEGVGVLDGVMAEQYRGNINNAPPSAFLPAGKTVCDAYGNTAVLVNEARPDKGGQIYPVARQFATTEDRERIRQAMQRVQAKWTAGSN